LIEVQKLKTKHWNLPKLAVSREFQKASLDEIAERYGSNQEWLSASNPKNFQLVDN